MPLNAMTLKAHQTTRYHLYTQGKLWRRKNRISKPLLINEHRAWIQYPRKEKTVKIMYASKQVDEIINHRAEGAKKDSQTTQKLPHCTEGERRQESSRSIETSEVEFRDPSPRTYSPKAIISRSYRVLSSRTKTESKSVNSNNVQSNNVRTQSTSPTRGTKTSKMDRIKRPRKLPFIINQHSSETYSKM